MLLGQLVVLDQLVQLEQLVQQVELDQLVLPVELGQLVQQDLQAQCPVQLGLQDLLQLVQLGLQAL